MKFGATKFNESEVLIFGGLAALLYILYKGGLKGAAQSAATALTSAVTGVVTGAATGAVDGVGQGIGLPALSDITTDPAVARYIIDDPRGGYLKASEYASAQALYGGIQMAEGSGTPPPANSKLAQLFPPYINTGGATGDW